MYSDLFDQLGGGAGGGRAARAAAGESSSARVAAGPPPLVSIKAGKMTMRPKEDSNDDNKAFDCVADTTRGEIRLVYADSMLQWQWYNRREQSVVDKTLIPPQGPPAGTLERISLEGKKHEKDRIYVWTHYPVAEGEGEPKVQYDMYWMQDESEEKEDETIAKINQYLADPSSAVPEEEAAAAVAAPAAAVASSSSSSSSNNNNNNQEQVDALSNILENLGMPQQQQSATGATASTSAASTGTLTLADLQGAMAGMQQQQQTAAASQPVPLNEIVTPAAMEKLLANDQVCDRLLPLLPETQRTKEALADNLKSPQVQQTLRSLTQALLPDDTGNMDGFASVLANFQLPEADMTTAMTNPIQAFLDAILKSVQGDGNDDDDDKMEEEEAKQEDEGSA